MKSIFSTAFIDNLSLEDNLLNRPNRKNQMWKLNKSTYSSFFLFLISLSSYCQFDSLEHKYFNNDSIHYDIIYVSHSVLSKRSNRVSKHYIRIGMSKDYRNYLLAKDSVFWMERLRNENSDWATCLILYYLHDREASALIVFNNRKKWLRIKEDDLEYWRKILSNRHKYPISNK